MYLTSNQNSVNFEINGKKNIRNSRHSISLFIQNQFFGGSDNTPSMTLTLNYSLHTQPYSYHIADSFELSGFSFRLVLLSCRKSSFSGTRSSVVGRGCSVADLSLLL